MRMTYREECRYSGERSKKFWKRVGALDNDRIKDWVYFQGVCLQDFESRVLQSLERAEREMAGDEL